MFFIVILVITKFIRFVPNCNILITIIIFVVKGSSVKNITWAEMECFSSYVGTLCSKNS